MRSTVGKTTLHGTPLSIVSPHYSLNKQGTQWLSDDDQQPDERELRALLLALASVQIEGVAGEDLQRTLSIAVPDIKLAVQTEQGETLFKFFTLGTRHYIHCSDHALFFTLSNYDFDRFSTLDSRRLRGEG